jgi:hypothetical protein
VSLASLTTVGVFSTIVLSVPVGGNPSLCACPAAWGVSPRPPATPGSTGCQDLLGESCFAVMLESNVAEVHLSGQRFEVLGPPGNNLSLENGAPMILGPSAIVTALNVSGNLVGIWNWTTST